MFVKLASDLFEVEASDRVLTGGSGFADDATEIGFTLALSRAGKSSD